MDTMPRRREPLAASGGSMPEAEISSEKWHPHPDSRLPTLAESDSRFVTPAATQTQAVLPELRPVEDLAARYWPRRSMHRRWPIRIRRAIARAASSPWGPRIQAMASCRHRSQAARRAANASPADNQYSCVRNGAWATVQQSSSPLSVADPGCKNRNHRAKNPSGWAHRQLRKTRARALCTDRPIRATPHWARLWRSPPGSRVRQTRDRSQLPRFYVFESVAQFVGGQRMVNVFLKIRCGPTSPRRQP